MWVVYQISGDLDNHVYYGYSMAEDETQLLAKWIKQADRTEDRGDKRLYELNQSNDEYVKLTVMDVFNDELDAWMTRNDLRASDCNSITGPTYFPGQLFERAKQTLTEDVRNRWKQSIDMHNAATARMAYKLGRWTFPQIKQLSDTYDKSVIAEDLDQLSPVDFNSKYFPSIS